MLDRIDLWKFAVQESSLPCSFVSLNDKFLFANVAWCRMVGYSEAELLTRTWQSITLLEDVGADQAETGKVKGSESARYYMEKTYIRKDGSNLLVEMMVVRFPSIGDQLGYVVFATPVEGSGEVEKLRAEFQRFCSRVAELESNVQHNAESVQQVISEQKADRDSVLAMMSRSQTVIGGDVNRDSFNRQDNHSVHTSNGGAVLMLVAVLLVVVVVFGCLGVFMMWGR